MHDARNAGVDDFLAKPISAKSLLSRIMAVLGEPRKFIRSGDYFGPDRRRKDSPSYRGAERRKVNIVSEGDGEDQLSQDEVEALLKG